jgi:hypothetical protein
LVHAGSLLLSPLQQGLDEAAASLGDLRPAAKKRTGRREERRRGGERKAVREGGCMGAGEVDVSGRRGRRQPLGHVFPSLPHHLFPSLPPSPPPPLPPSLTTSPLPHSPPLTLEGDWRVADGFAHVVNLRHGRGLPALPEWKPAGKEPAGGGGRRQGKEDWSGRSRAGRSGSASTRPLPPLPPAPSQRPVPLQQSLTSTG